MNSTKAIQARWRRHHVTRDGQVMVHRGATVAYGGRVWREGTAWRCDLNGSRYGSQADAIRGLLASINGPA